MWTIYEISTTMYDSSHRTVLHSSYTDTVRREDLATRTCIRKASKCTTHVVYCLERIVASMDTSNSYNTCVCVCVCVCVIKPALLYTSGCHAQEQTTPYVGTYTTLCYMYSQSPQICTCTGTCIQQINPP